ncbi:MAG: hypothetical protein MSS80_08405 [Mollicutes bacterium]|nr:hypothetical protein [Mollicutes bacterium]
MSKKSKSSKQNIKKDNVKMATPEQISTLQNFVKTYSADLSRQLRQLDLITQISSNKGRYSPILSEQYVNDVNFNPQKADSNAISKWLMSPQRYDMNIRHLSQYLENAVGQYGRAIWFLNTEKSFNYLLTPADADNSEAINTDAYVNSYNMALNTLRKMNIKYQFPKMDLQVMEDGVGFYFIQETEDTITFLQLPTDYCYITAPWTYGWLFAIDLTFFDRLVGMPDILPELTEAYKVFVEKRKEGYTGAKLAPFQYFNLPPEKSFCLTFNPNRADKIPPLTGAMGASLDVLSYRDLLKKKSVLDLWKLIAMKIPIDKQTNKMQIPYDEAAELIAMIKEQMPENIVAFATPFDAQEVAANQVNTMDKLVDLGDNNVFSALGMGAAMFGKDNKNAGQLKISSQVSFDYASTHMYSQFANLANWIIAQKTKTYKWKVSFFGNKLDKDKEIDNAIKLVTSSNYPVEYLMAHTGFEPFEMKSFINWANKMDLKSKMKPLQSMNTMSNKPGDEGGRPQKDVGDMQESGEKSREYKDNRG